MNALRRTAVPAARAAVPRTLVPRRTMGAGGGRPWADKQSPYYGHFKPQPVHEVLGTIYATTMWVWMMYRAEKAVGVGLQTSLGLSLSAVA